MVAFALVMNVLFYDYDMMVMMYKEGSQLSFLFLSPYEALASRGREPSAVTDLVYIVSWTHSLRIPCLEGERTDLFSLDR